MLKKPWCLRSLSLTWLIVLISTGSPAAQPVWLAGSGGNGIGIEVLKPKLKDGSEFTATSSAVFISGRVASGAQLFLIGELPFAHAGVDNAFVSESETVIGNPYVGVEVHSPGLSNYFEFGARLPLAPSDKFIAPFIGSMADFDRLEAFSQDLVVISGKVNFVKRTDRRVYTRVRVGPTVWIPTGDGDSDIWFDYSAQAGFGDRVVFLLGLTGRMLISETGLDLGERTVHHLGASVSFALGDRVRPGAHLRLPLDKDLTDNYDFSYGINLAVLMP